MNIYLRYLLDMKINTKAGDYKDIANRLREIRLDARLTQKDMADVVGLTPGSVGAMENGLYTPNYDVLRALKKKLNISYDYLIDGDKTSASRQEIEQLRQEVIRLTKIIDKLIK